MSARCPVTLVTGFLGAGKTTLINAVLREPGFARSLVIVNEFGDVGLDHLLVGQADDQVLLLESGCLCCAATGGLRDALIDLFARRSSGRIPHFDRVIVETSGLANPAPLIATLLGDSAIAPRCELQQVLTLVDGQNGTDTLARHPDAQRQVALADRLLVTKLEGGALPAALGEALRHLNPDAVIEVRDAGTSAWPHFAALPSASRAGGWPRGPLRPQYAGDFNDAHAQRAVAPFSRSWQLDHAIDWPHYAEWTASLTRQFGARLLRCKGIVDVAGQPWVVQGVLGRFNPPQRLPAWPSGERRGFIVCIAEDIDPQALAVAMQGLCREPRSVTS